MLSKQQKGTADESRRANFYYQSTSIKYKHVSLQVLEFYYDQDCLIDLRQLLAYYQRVYRMTREHRLNLRVQVRV